jgi:hypothetical protein
MKAHSGGDVVANPKKIEPVIFQAEWGGLSINKDGVLKAKLVAPYNQTGEVLQLTRLWTLNVHVSLQTKRHVEADFKLVDLHFKSDGQTVTTLQANARELLGEQAALIVRFKRGVMIAVTVTKLELTEEPAR